MLKIEYHPSILDDDIECWTQDHQKGRRLSSYLKDKHVTEHSLIEINGKVKDSKEALRRAPRDGDVIVVAQVPRVFIPVVTAVIAAAAAAAAPAATTAATITTIALVASSVLVAAVIIGPIVLAAVNRPNLSQAGSLNSNTDNEVNSPSRGFSGAQNTFGPGRVIPVAMGTIRVGGQIIESFLSPKLDFFDETDPNLDIKVETEEEDKGPDRLNTRVAVAQGPIKSITALQIDDNPIEDIIGVQVETVPGTDIDKILDGFERETRIQKTIATAVTVAGGAVTEFTRTTGAVDVVVSSVEVALFFPGGLFRVDATTSDLITQEVQVLLEFKDTSGPAPFDVFKTITISDNVQGPKTVWIRFPNFAFNGPGLDVYQIRVTRITADNVDISIQDDFQWEFLVMIQPGARAHPGIAQAGIRQIPQEQSSAPRRYSFLVEGLSDVRVYTDDTTFTEMWTDNPAWLCARWITDPIWGMGKWYTYDDIDIPAFLLWAEHCNEAIPDGRGGFDRRCQFNFILDTATGSQEILEAFGAVSDANVIDLGGRWSVVIDKIRPIKRRFNEGNYVRESLIYSFRDTTVAAQRVIANFLNRENNYRREVLIQEDFNVPETEIFREEEINLWGLTSPAQVAQQLTKIINANKFQDRTLEFEAGISAFTLGVGDRLAVATNTGSLPVANGRILSVTADLLTLQLDEEFTLELAKTYEIVVQHSLDAELSKKRLVGITDIISNWVTIDNARWTRKPLPGDLYHLHELVIEEESWVIVDTQLDQNLNKKIRCVAYDENVYQDTIVSNPRDSVPAPAPEATLIPPAVASVTAFARKPVNSGGTDSINVIDVTWQPATGDKAFVGEYQVWWKEDNVVHWRIAGTSKGTHHCIVESIRVGSTYQIAVVPTSHLGRRLHVQDSRRTTVTIPT